MLGGTTYECGVCPICGGYNFWNDNECMSCGYVKPEEESEESEE